MKSLRQTLVLLMLLCVFPCMANSEAVDAPVLRSLVQRGRLDDLRWPDFRDLQPDVQRFYELNGNASAWIEDGKPTERALAMITVLQQAESEGLNPDDYDAARWPERLAELHSAHTLKEEAGFDVALTVCAMRFMSAVHIGRANPQAGDAGGNLDLAAYLHAALNSSDTLDEEMTALDPPFAAYQRIKRVLVRYRQLATQPDGEELPPSVGKVVRGGYYDHTAALAKRLQHLGDLPADVPIPSPTASYDGPVLTGVRRFQARHGLNPTGTLDQKTLDKLNVPVRERVEQLRLTMERFRWLSQDLQGPLLVVNVPELRLRAYDETGQAALSMRVAVGDANGYQTPTLRSSIHNVIFRPYWYVPPDIFREEILPGIESDRRYVEVNHMEVLTRAGKLVTTGMITDRVLRGLRQGSLVAREKPGPENPLGLLKLNFPNSYDVYIHDTPASMNLFSGDEADVSHGCIHVEEPVKLARWLLRDRPEWTDESIEAAMTQGRDENVVQLTRPVPVLILYATATVDVDGTVHFFDDIYGQDQELIEQLAKSYR